MTNWLKNPNGTNAATVVTFDRAVIDRAGQARFSALRLLSDYKDPNYWGLYGSSSGSASEHGTRCSEFTAFVGCWAFYSSSSFTLSSIQFLTFHLFIFILYWSLEGVRILCDGKVEPYPKMDA